MILFDAGKGSIRKFGENAYLVTFYLSGKNVNIGTYSSKELAEEARDYFISINYDLDKFKESKYWKELRNVGATSEEKRGQGAIRKSSENAYQVLFFLNGKRVSIGTYPSKELAEEVRDYFISINRDLNKFKESKYWKELKNVGANSEGKKGQGTVHKLDENAYRVLFGNNDNKKIELGVYSSKELAEEARNYFISINRDLDKFKESKYWTERTDKRQTSKNYWNHITMNKKNTSGVTGVSLERTRFSNGNACWRSFIHIGYKIIVKHFYSKEAAIQYRLELEQLGHEFNENHDKKRLEEQMKYIEERARNMEEEKIAEKAAEAYRKGIENPDGEDTSTWDSKERKKKMKRLNVGDSINFKDGRVGIVEDYDEKYYYVKDNNTNIVKILKDNTPKDYTSIQNMTSRLKTILKETSTFQNDKNFGAVEFKKLLEANGFEVEYVENKSGTWQKDDYNEYFKNYDIKLTDGQHIYFRVIADDNFDTKEVICYLNGKNW